MRYDYECKKCKKTFEVSHGMRERPKVLCSKCKGACEKKINADIAVYTKGKGYLDRAGVKRDMNLHKLVNDDPYARWRTPGEKSDIADKLRKGGKRKTNKRHFMVKK